MDTSQEMISKYFSIRETIASVTAEQEGIANVPTDLVARTLIQTARYMDGIREYLGHPIIPSSWYRSPSLSIAVGSKATSQHGKGEAVDWNCPAYGSCYEIAKVLEAKRWEFQIDQLILERRNGKEWIHTSFAIAPPRKPRYQVLTLLHGGGYATGITDSYGKLING